MPNLTQLLTLDRAFSVAITRAEAHTPRMPLPRHVPRKHVALVEAPHAVKVALSRFLVWHSYLRSRKPTRASMERAAHRARGQMLWRMGILAQRQGISAQRDIPAFALQSPPGAVTRADNSGNDNTDPVVWWDDSWGEVYGPDFDFSTLYDPTVRSLTPEEKAALLADIGAQLDYDTWLHEVFLQDLQVLQLLESYWNGQTTNAAGQDFLDAAGLIGDFNIIDQNMLNYLQRDAGMFVTRIDEYTRQQLAWSLWEGLGGDGGAPLAMQGLARYIQDQMSAWNNKLSGMSDQRAMLIAVTETARAETFGNFIAMWQGGVKNKIWVVTAGACARCLTNMEQGEVPLLEPFPTGVLAPPDHPRCRCSFTASLSGFNPNDWSWSPDPAQLDSIMSNPSWGLWPKWVADLEQPALNLVEPAKVGLLKWDDLPDAVQAVLKPEVMNAIQRQLGDAVDIDDFMARLEALKGTSSIPTDVTVPAPLAPGETPTADATPLLSAEELLQNLMENPPEGGVDEATRESEEQFLKRFREILGDIQNFNTEGE